MFPPPPLRYYPNINGTNSINENIIHAAETYVFIQSIMSLCHLSRPIKVSLSAKYSKKFPQNLQFLQVKFV